MPIALTIIGSVILGLCIMGGIVILAASLLHKMLSSKEKDSSGEEARLLQEINAKLNKLEKRIESLETIVTASEHNPRV